MNSLTKALVVSTALICTGAFAKEGASPKRYQVFISPTQSEDGFRRSASAVQSLVYEVMQPGDQVTAFLAGQPREIASLSLPILGEPLSVKARSRLDNHAGFSAAVIGTLKQQHPTAHDGGLDIPQSTRFTADRLRTGGRRDGTVIVFLGSPLYVAPNEKLAAASMGTSYPDDQWLIETGSPYDIRWGAMTLADIPVHLLITDSVRGQTPFINAVHEQGVTTFWCNYFKGLGARLIDMTADVQRVKTYGELATPAIECSMKPSGRLVMNPAEFTLGPEILGLEPDRDGRTTHTPSGGNAEIALSWKGDADLDLYVTHKTSGAQVNFAKSWARTPAGELRFYRDTASPGSNDNQFGWEMATIKVGKVDGFKAEEYEVAVKVAKPPTKTGDGVQFQLRTWVGNRLHVSDGKFVFGHKESPNSDGAWRSSLAQLAN